MVETSVDDRIIFNGLNEDGCACTGNISLFQCNAKWRAFVLLTESEQDWALQQGRKNTDVVRSTASSPAIKRALCMLQIVWEDLYGFWDILLPVGYSVYVLVLETAQQIWCDFDRASSLICGNKMPARCNRGFYCRYYCLLHMFRAPLCPSSGAQEYYTVVAACGISCCGFQVAGLVWSWGLCVRFAGCMWK